MISGTLISTQASSTGSLVFRIPSLLNIMYSGMVKATGGSTRTSRTQYVMGFFRPNRNRRPSQKNPFPPRRSRSSETNREPNVVCKLLMMAVPKFLAENSSAKWMPVKLWGIKAICPLISSVGRIAIATSQ